MKKIFRLLIPSILGVGIIVLLANSYPTEAVETEEQVDNIEADFPDSFWQKDVEGDVAVEVPPLNQEEYDNLIDSLPEGAELVGEVEVLPGVVK